MRITIYKLYQTFKGREDIYSVDLSNFVPFTTTVPTAVGGGSFNFAGSNNFGLLQLQEAFTSCTYLSVVNLNSITSNITTNNDTMISAFSDCTHLTTIYCNQVIANIISIGLSADNSFSTRTWSYNDTIGAIVFSPKQSSST